MKKGMTKLIGTVSAAVMFVSAMPFTVSAATASAENVPILDLSAEGDYYIPVSLVEKSDVAVRIKVYAESTENEKFNAAKLKFI